MGIKLVASCKQQRQIRPNMESMVQEFHGFFRKIYFFEINENCKQTWLSDARFPIDYRQGESD
jgi:hypothetical protein